MSDECYAMVRGSVMRVTELDRCGDVAEEPRYAASKSVAKVTINEMVESASNELVRTPEEEIRLHFVRPAQPIRFKVDVNFLRCDPGILNLMTGVPLVQNAAGDVVGFDANTKLPAKAFALEVWSHLTGVACTTQTVTLGYGGGDPFGGGEVYGESPTAEVGRRWGYTLFPFLKGGVLSGFVFQNGLVSFNLLGAQTRRGSKWGLGPWPLDEQGLPLLTPVSRNTNWRTFITYGEPPQQTDGIVEPVVSVLDGGDATSTSSDVIDGEFVVTSSDVVEGGNAA